MSRSMTSQSLCSRADNFLETGTGWEIWKMNRYDMLINKQVEKWERSFLLCFMEMLMSPEIWEVPFKILLKKLPKQ